MEGVPSWKITSENQHNLMAYKKNRQSEVAYPKENPIFTFYLTQIQVVSFQCNQFLI